MLELLRYFGVIIIMVLCIVIFIVAVVYIAGLAREELDKWYEHKL